MSDKERQIPYDFTYMWNLKIKQMNKKKKTETKTLNWVWGETFFSCFNQLILILWTKTKIKGSIESMYI